MFLFDIKSRNILHFSVPSLDGLEPPMLDETWGLSNHTLNYKGRYSKQPFASSTVDTTTELSKFIGQKFEQGSVIVNVIVKQTFCLFYIYRCILYLINKTPNSSF